MFKSFFVYADSNNQCWGSRLFEILVFEMRISNTIRVFFICISNTLLKKYFVSVFQIHLSSSLFVFENILMKYKNTIQNCLSNNEYSSFHF